jgi:2-polyprenyl-3-methyl-5-hydroxy-6-metoxy-1,4-benzoquinol methylase
MGVQLDPERHEIEALFDIVDDFAGKRVLEVGCGDGRLTWEYADRAAFVTGIDPDPEEIATAIEGTPSGLIGNVEFVVSGIEGFNASLPYDLVILSWSL